MNDIHPTAVIEDCVKMGDNNYIGPFCYFTGGTEIGSNNRFLKLFVLSVLDLNMKNFGIKMVN